MTDELICAIYYTARNTSLAEFKDRIRALLADGGKGEAVRFQSPLDGRWITAPQAECAPREAQPEQGKWAVRGRSLYLNGVLEANAVTERAAHKIAGQLNTYRSMCEQEVAPTPERAQESAGVLTDDLIAEWMAKCEELRKDAERYRWLRDEGDLSVRDVFGSWCRELNDGLDAAIDAAYKPNAMKETK